LKKQVHGTKSPYAKLTRERYLASDIFNWSNSTLLAILKN